MHIYKIKRSKIESIFISQNKSMNIILFLEHLLLKQKTLWAALMPTVGCVLNLDS